MAINLRRMGRPKAAPISHELVSIYPIQRKMMTFYQENNRCAIICPRRAGKSTFLAMQAVLSQHRNTLIISPTNSMSLHMVENVRDVLRSNNRNYNYSRSGQRHIFTIGGFHIECISRSLYTDVILSNYDEIFVDEFFLMDMGMFLKHQKRVILIGTDEWNDGPQNMDVDVSGVFAGLNINGD